jgi:ubiquinone/menaquinone biosynthesis C-methylase UbiE
MWLTAHIMNAYEKKLKSFCSVDYSEHCLINVGQEVLKHYKVNCEKLSLCVGSFYDIKRPDASLDFIVMSQAFHHADDPNKLLKEMRRVLKPGGFIIMIGELFIPKPLYLKCYANYVVSRICSSKFFPKIFKKIKLLDRLGSKKFKGDFQDIYFPPDPNLGDHYYLESQYRRFFRENNFMFKRVPASLVNHLSYVLFKKCKKVH